MAGPDALTAGPMPDDGRGPTSILLTNLWSDDNKGDLAITAGLVRAITAAGCDTVVSGVSSFGARQHPHAHRFVHRSLDQIYEPVWRPHNGATLAWLRRSLDMLVAVATLAHPRLAADLFRRNRPLVDALTAADLVIAKGGQYLHDRSASVRDQVGFLRQVHVLLLALRMRRPVVLAGHSFRPPRGRSTRTVLRFVMRRARMWWVREPESLTTARTLDPTRATQVGADTAFGLLEAPHCDPTERGRGPILVVPRWVPGLPLGDDAHVRAIAAGIAPFGRDRRIVVVAQGLGPSPLETDTSCADRLEELFVEHGVTAEQIRGDLDISELVDLYAQAAVVVAVRLHAAILAMVAGTPAVAIGYDGPKTSGLYCKAELAHFAFEVRTIDPGVLRDAVAAAMDPSVGEAFRRFAAGEAAWVRAAARTVAGAS